MQYDENKINEDNIKINVNKKSKKEIFSKITYCLISLLALIVIVISISFLVQIKILNKNYGNLFGYTVLQVKSGSMQKEIMISDLVIVEILANSNQDNIDQIKENIEVNDVITFNRENYLITHRVIEKNENNLITKGDANNTADKAVDYEDVVGKVVKIIPNIAIWKKVFSEKSVLIPLSSGVLLLIITMMIDDSEEVEEEVDGKKKQKIQKGKRFKN